MSVTRSAVRPRHTRAGEGVSGLERNFRNKVDDLHLRPIHYRLEDCVCAHVLVAMLAARWAIVTGASAMEG